MIFRDHVFQVLEVSCYCFALRVIKAGMVESVVVESGKVFDFINAMKMVNLDIRGVNRNSDAPSY